VKEQSKDDWLPCEIADRVEIPILHTDLQLISFNVRYYVTLEDGSIRVQYEEGVKSDRVRLLASADGAVQGLPEVSAVGNDPIDVLQPLARMRDSNTGRCVQTVRHRVYTVDTNDLMSTCCSSPGIGMWQTVSVREVDEEEQYLEYMRSEQARSEMLSTAHAPGLGIGNRSSSSSGKTSNPRDQADYEGNMAIGDREEDNHSALSAFDPYGRHLQVYKGIKLYEDSVRKEQVGAHLNAPINTYSEVTVDYYAML